MRRNLNWCRRMTSYTHTSSPDCTGSCRSCSAVGSCPDRIVCRCLKVTEQTVIDAITAGGARTLRELRQATGAGTGCNCCHKELTAYLDVYAGRAALPLAAHTS